MCLSDFTFQAFMPLHQTESSERDCGFLSSSYVCAFKCFKFKCTKASLRRGVYLLVRQNRTTQNMGKVVVSYITAISSVGFDTSSSLYENLEIFA